MATIRLLIADASDFGRFALNALVASEPDVSIVGMAADSQELASCLQQGNADLLLLDVSLPGIDAPNVVAQLRLCSPGLPMLAVGVGEDVRLVRRALDGGADGYLRKDCDPATVLAAIRKVAAGGRHLDPQIAQQVVFDRLNVTDFSAGPGILTERERQVMRLLADGASIKSIALRFDISSKTASAYKTRLMRKMNFASIADLVRYTVTHEIQ